MVRVEQIDTMVWRISTGVVRWIISNYGVGVEGYPLWVAPLGDDLQALDPVAMSDGSVLATWTDGQDKIFATLWQRYAVINGVVFETSLAPSKEAE